MTFNVRRTYKCVKEVFDLLFKAEDNISSFYSSNNEAISAFNTNAYLYGVNVQILRIYISKFF